MKLGFIFHLYQPYNQKEEVFRKVYSECYSPLVKFLKSHRDFNLNLNVPLSLLELMDKYGYEAWIDDLRALVDSSRVELMGSAAYHALLPHLTKKVIEEEILLNETGLGYYLGSRQDFEGSPASMIKDISGFFPPELAVNDKLLSILSSLGYEWLVSNNVSLCVNDVCPIKSSIYTVKDYPVRVLIRDHVLSNMLAFKRELDVSDIMNHLNKGDASSSYFVVLDGETFGHHYRDGIALLEILYAKMRSVGIVVSTVSRIIENEDSVPVDNIYESTWGSVKCEEHGECGYPLWLNVNNKAQNLLKEQQDIVLKIMESLNSNVITSITPWTKDDILENAYMDLHRYLCSDKFWWLSKVTLPRGEYLYQREIVLKYLDLIKENVHLIKQEDVYKNISELDITLRELVK